MDLHEFTESKTKSQLNALNKNELVKRCLDLQNDNAFIKSVIQNLQDKVDVLGTAVGEIRKNQSTNISTESNPAMDKRMINLEKDNFSCQQYSRRDTVEIAGFTS